MEMLRTVAKAWNIPDIRKKIIFTLLMLLIFRIGSQIPVPGIDREILSQTFDSETGLFALFNLFSGGAFSNFTIFALSIAPYVTASIILQLLTFAIPPLERLAREGTEGRKKIAQYTRYLTVCAGDSAGCRRFPGPLQAGPDQHGRIFHNRDSDSEIARFLMWLGEQINEHGIGNGISLIMFAGIVSRLPSAIQEIWVRVQDGTMSIVTLILFLLFCVLVIVGIIEVQQGQRRIPVQYAKRVVGRKMYGGQATHIPLKVNQAGVIPVIFAMAFLQFPLTITYFMSSESGAVAWITKWLSPVGTPGVWVYAACNVVLIILFTYFYTSVTFNPMEIAQNMKANGGFIPGIRPGKATVEYLNRVMTRITFVGAIFLAAVAILPTIVSQLGGLNFHFGGTSLLIAVGVALDTMKQLEQQMVMRNYQGFLK